MTEKLTRADIRSLARFRAGLILQSVLFNGWHPEDMADRYGDGAVDRIAAEIDKIARRLTGED